MLKKIIKSFCSKWNLIIFIKSLITLKSYLKTRFIVFYSKYDNVLTRTCHIFYIAYYPDTPKHSSDNVLGLAHVIIVKIFDR